MDLTEHEGWNVGMKRSEISEKTSRIRKIEQNEYRLRRERCVDEKNVEQIRVDARYIEGI